MTAPLDMTDTATAIAVVGSDLVSTGKSALDIARTAATTRRVTIIDLLGDSPTLVNEMTTDDPHGVTDCFTYGISFAAVMHGTKDPNITVIPTGTGALDYAAMLANSRWESVVRQARDNDTLLVLAVPPQAAELGELLAHVDRVVAADLPTRASLAPRLLATPGSAGHPRRATRMSRALAAGLIIAIVGVGAAAAYAWVQGWRGTGGTEVATAQTPGSTIDTVTSQSNARIATPSGATNDKTAAPAPSSAAPTEGSTSDSSYDIQFVATPDSDLARTLVHRITRLGFTPRIATLESDARETYRVLLGPYPTRAAADSVARLTRTSYWVRAHIAR